MHFTLLVPLQLTGLALFFLTLFLLQMKMNVGEGEITMVCIKNCTGLLWWDI